MKLKGGENMNLKAQAGGMAFLATFAIGFIIAGIYLTLGADITNEFQGEYTANSAPYNITSEVQTGNLSLAERLPLIALVVGIVIVIGYLTMVRM